MRPRPTLVCRQAPECWQENIGTVTIGIASREPSGLAALPRCDVLERRPKKHPTTSRAWQGCCCRQGATADCCCRLLLPTPVVADTADRCGAAVVHVTAGSGLPLRRRGTLRSAPKPSNATGRWWWCDATQDPRFRDNPLVTGKPGIRSMACCWEKPCAVPRKRSPRHAEEAIAGFAVRTRLTNSSWRIRRSRRPPKAVPRRPRLWPPRVRHPVVSPFEFGCRREAVPRRDRALP